MGFRNTVKLLSQGGDMIQLCHELRLPFVDWVARNQVKLLFSFFISLFQDLHHAI